MEALTPWILGLTIPAAMAILLRFLPKAKLIAWVSPVCKTTGKALSAILVLRLGKKAAESIEEGIFATLAATIYAAVDSFMQGLKSDS